MYSVFWTIAIAISVAGTFLVLNPTQNAAMAYSCNSSSSTSEGGASSSVNGNSGGCATVASSSSTARGVGLGFIFPVPPNFSGAASSNPLPGIAISSSGGGSQSSCLAQLANHNDVGNTRGAFPQSGGCSSHSP